MMVWPDPGKLGGVLPALVLWGVSWLVLSVCRGAGAGHSPCSGHRQFGRKPEVAPPDAYRARDRYRTAQGVRAVHRWSEARLGALEKVLGLAQDHDISGQYMGNLWRVNP